MYFVFNRPVHECGLLICKYFLDINKGMWHTGIKYIDGGNHSFCIRVKLANH